MLRSLAPVAALAAYLTVGLLSAVVVVAGLLEAPRVPDCPTEDATAAACFWDAGERGNGEGFSFSVCGDVVTYTDARPTVADCR